ncbi:Protein ecdysoneless-like [Acipenser ruthenus]|uniref:Protein ecdysoneless-like n=1 Tax=Acipenser ruthenus TaxID=7906 RepID=A0A444UKT2_ACIRT|nr:Protein ecdysoneless-like [Acipenser ruthenus]
MIAEDSVQYSLFLVPPDPSDTKDREKCLQQYIERILAQFAPLLTQYIWQNQPFSIKYVPEKGVVPAHIRGCTNFGDNVEDEWFIVYLIQQITKVFPELAARIEDNDGEFLLIEAAECLPKWLNPDSSTNRVFFFQGEFHIIPVPRNPAETPWLPKGTLTIPQAVNLLSTHPETCLAAEPIRKALGKRLKGYPLKIQSNLHLAHCYIPAGIAATLKLRPDLVAPAVLAFYLRDPIDLQACRTFSTFPPETRVMASVTFTRCLYAQLLQQRFSADRRSGFTLPPRSHPKFKAHELGIKLAHGFEIMCSKCTKRSSEPGAPVCNNPLWKGFLNSLKKNDYFKGELEGSARYKELLRMAESFFQQSAAITQSSSALLPGEEVLQLLESTPYSLEELKKEESSLPAEDSERWLEMTPEELEQLLEEATGRGIQSAAHGGAEGEEKEEEEEEESYSLSAVTHSMKAFINKVSTHEGAELPCAPDEELDSDDLEDDDDDIDYDDEDLLGSDDEPGGDSNSGALGNLRAYMAEMDRELAGTNIGKSFSTHSKADAGAADLSRGSGHDDKGDEDGDDNNEDLQAAGGAVPLDLDFNLVSNLLESFSSQEGLAGPASNILHSMGVRLPHNTDKS